MYNFYKGYCPTKDKACLVKFSNPRNLKSYDQVKNYREFAGVLNTNSLILDIDDSVQSEILLNLVIKLKIKTKVIKTSRGKHFLFKNTIFKQCRTHAQLAIGLIADIKVGFVNSYEVIKFNGIEREVQYANGDSDSDYDELPYFLWPLKLTEKNQIDFINLHEGSRNDTLFKYILTLQNNGLNVSQIRDSIRLLNQHVLRDPLTDEELDIILRDDSFKTDIKVKIPNLPNFFTTKGVFLHETFAKYLRDTYKIKKINGRLHIFNDGVYSSDYQLIENKMISIIYNLSDNKRKEVIKFLEILCSTDDYSVSSDYICLKNGLFSFNDFTLHDFKSDIILTNKINVDYNPYAKSPLIDTIMNNITLSNTDLIKLLYEMIGYTLYPSNKLGKAFILTGDGANGKSTFLDIIKNLLGNKNYSSLDLKYLSDRFSTVMLYNKLANIADDISDDFIDDTSLFKKVVTGETITAEFKGQQRFDFTPLCKVICSTNSIPRFGKGKDAKAIGRRLIIIPFNADFSNSKDNFIGERLNSSDCLEYILFMALFHLKSLLATQTFTNPDIVNSEHSSFMYENDPLLEFLETYDWNFKSQPVITAYTNYTSYCIDNGFKEVGRRTFTNRVLKKFTFLETKNVMKNGIREYYFVNNNKDFDFLDGFE